MREHSAPAPAPQSALEVANEAFEFLRAHSRQLLGLAALVQIPVQLVLAFLNRAAYEGGASVTFVNGSAPVETSSSTSFGVASTLVSGRTLLVALALAVIAVPAARLVAAWKTGRSIPTGQAFRVPAKTWVSLVVVVLLVHVFEIVGVVGLFVGSVFVMVVFAVATPVVALEGTWPFRAIGRAWTLSLRRFGPVLGSVLAMTLVTLLLSYAFGSGLATLPEFVGFSGGWVFAGVCEVVAGIITSAVTAVYVATLYIDLRVWTEGMDIAVALSGAPVLPSRQGTPGAQSPAPPGTAVSQVP